MGSAIGARVAEQTIITALYVIDVKREVVTEAIDRTKRPEVVDVFLFPPYEFEFGSSLSQKGASDPTP